MATTSQRDRLRSDLGLTCYELPDALADQYYTWGQDDYPDNAAAAGATTRLIVIDNLLAQAAKRTDYRQNQSEEKLSQLFEHLRALRKIYTDALDDALNAGSTWVMFGGLRRRDNPRIDRPYHREGWFCDDVSRDVRW